MRNHAARGLAFVLTLGLAIASPVVAQAPVVTGIFVLGGADAKLAHVRAVRTQLDERTKGYALLLSPAAVTGEILSWRTADPAERGSFVFLMLAPTGDIWIAELGHAARKGGRFGVVTELKRVAFAVKGDRITGHYRTGGPETFGDSTYTIDLTFDAPIEGQ